MQLKKPIGCGRGEVVRVVDGRTGKSGSRFLADLIPSNSGFRDKWLLDISLV